MPFEECRSNFFQNISQFEFPYDSVGVVGFGEERLRGEVPLSWDHVLGYMRAAWLVTGDVTFITCLRWCLPAFFSKSYCFSLPYSAVFNPVTKCSPQSWRGDHSSVSWKVGIYMYYLDDSCRGDFPLFLYFFICWIIYYREKSFLKMRKIVHLNVDGNNPMKSKILWEFL